MGSLTKRRKQQYHRYRLNSVSQWHLHCTEQKQQHTLQNAWKRCQLPLAQLIYFFVFSSSSSSRCTYFFFPSFFHRFLCWDAENRWCCCCCCCWSAECRAAFFAAEKQLALTKQLQLSSCGSFLQAKKEKRIRTPHFSSVFSPTKQK